MKDPIVEAVRTERKRIAARYNYDIHAIVQAARRGQQSHKKRSIISCTKKLSKPK